MNSPAVEQLQQFILSNSLTREEGVILFDATVACQRNNRFFQIESQVQIIVLPDEMALYILEFIKEEFHEADMYSTRQFNFLSPAANRLEITGPAADLLISITASGKI